MADLGSAEAPSQTYRHEAEGPADSFRRPFVRPPIGGKSAGMRHDPLYRKITVDEFLAIDFGSDRKFELVDGAIRMMTGGTPAHSRVSSNILAYLHGRLRGTGCRAYNSDMGVCVNETDLRYPDVSVFCGNPATRERERERAFGDPTVIVEVLSGSTAKEDQGSKLAEYRELPSIETIVFVDPENELTRIIQRLGETAWRDDLFAQPHDVPLPSLGLTIPHTEIFARD